MKLAILETGVPPGDLATRFGDYPKMFGDLLGEGFQIESFDVQNGRFPEVGAHEACLITGSPAGVYDPLPWVGELLDFIRAAKDSKLVGVCFGHQAMSEALGGHVEKSDKGWGAGLHRYSVATRAPWMDEVATIAAPASHQDQVIVQPPCTDVILRSDFTPFAGLSWTDRDAISFQFHPEFSRGFAKALIEKRYDRVLEPDRAITSLDAPNDNARVGCWIRDFLNGETE